MADKVKVNFLGTGDSIPTAKRNHPAFLVGFRDENILIDCGEGTQRQFRYAGLNPCKITKILITHWHGDHVLGLPGLLKTLSVSDFPRKLYIYGPRGIKKHIEKMDEAFGKVHEFEIVVKEVSGKFVDEEDFYLEAESMTHGTPCNAYNFVVKGKRRIDKKKLEKLKLPHGPWLKKLKDGKDVSVEGKKVKYRDVTYSEESKKVSFVIDTTDNAKIAPFVRDADIFVSESTFDAEMKDKAKEHKHMTVDQVAKNAKKAKVKKLYLTHVSQRYAKNPKDILEKARSVFKESYLVRDLEGAEV